MPVPLDSPSPDHILLLLLKSPQVGGGTGLMEEPNGGYRCPVSAAPAASLCPIGLHTALTLSSAVPAELL